jgi:hypothetical protein
MESADPNDHLLEGTVGEHPLPDYGPVVSVIPPCGPARGVVWGLRAEIPGYPILYGFSGNLFYRRISESIRSDR